MALTNKEKKELIRCILTLDEKATASIREIIGQYFVIFWVFIFWDKIAHALMLRYEPGLGWEQITGALVCLVQMCRYYSKLN